MTKIPPRLILICGLPGAGKTTLAKTMEKELGLIRFCPDEWMADIGVDLYDEAARDRLEKKLWALTQDLLRKGQSVVLEYGFWGRSERDEKLIAARDLGATVELHFLDIPTSKLWARIEKRNKSNDPATPPMTRQMLDDSVKALQKPDQEELSQYDNYQKSAESERI